MIQWPDIQRYCDAIAREFKPQRILVFGSYAYERVGQAGRGTVPHRLRVHTKDRKEPRFDIAICDVKDRSARTANLSQRIDGRDGGTTRFKVANCSHERFPSDFAFLLEPQEVASLRSQFATSKGRGGRRYIPRAFTEHGAIMAASVLN
jgi:hypothetical protein